jgi:carbon-monoxide dehydrogenase medium subunit
MKPAPFDHHAPTTAEEAVGLLAELGDTAKLIAGGQSLVPMLALRLAVFEHLVDLGRVEGLRGVEHVEHVDGVGGVGGVGGSVRIGAATTQSTVERSADLATAVPLLARATPLIGHFQIRNRGTVGGSLAHADPAAEYPAVALALDAEMEILSTGGRRSVPASEFFDGLWSTAVGDDELLTAVTFPVWTGRCGFAVREFARRHGDFAIAGAAVAVELGEDDVVRRCAVGLLGLGPTPERAIAAEGALLGQEVDDVGGVPGIDADEIGRLAVSTLDAVPSDLHGSADYRRRVGAAMVTSAWRAASEEARRG